MGKNATATQKVTGGTPGIVVHGRQVEISQRFRDHVDDKLARIDRFGVVLMSIDVEVHHEQNPRLSDQAYEVELTCRGRGLVIRAEARAADKWAALDLAYERLEERLRRAADRRHDRQHGRGRAARGTRPADLPVGDLEIAAEVDGTGPVPSLDHAAGVDGIDRAAGVDGIHRAAGADHAVLDQADGHAPLPDGVVHRDGPVEVREKEHPSAPMTVAEAVDALELVGHDFYLFHDVDADAPSVVYRRRGYEYGVIRLRLATDGSDH